MRRLFVAAVTAALFTVGLATAGVAPAGADAACGNFSSTAGTCVNSQLTVAGTSYSVDWYLPNGTATGLMLLQHGFSRGCGNLRSTSKAVMAKGVMVLCLNADMSGGNPALGNALGDLLASRALTPPAGKALPVGYIVGGHSAGGHFASVVGARLAARNYAGLKGAVLFDAVAGSGFSANLQAISAGGTRPVLEIAARPGAINLNNNSFGALKDLPNTFVGVQLVWSGFFFGIPYGGSCHTDVEGENGDAIGNTAALCVPNSTVVARLRDLGSTWAKDLAAGTRTTGYWCTNSADRTTCGTRVKSLVTGSLPTSTLIAVS
ncbi:alpha/beta hydrolase [Aquihabitans sp. McL0605]|uniref:alpha/beta hydrolase n=1 Tax=Aquihabitans sp. McL0605 TaxID=3415671 RepID=UPI003CF98FEC